MDSLIDYFVIITEEGKDGYEIEFLPCVLDKFKLSIPNQGVNYHLKVSIESEFEMEIFNP